MAYIKKRDRVPNDPVEAAPKQRPFGPAMEKPELRNVYQEPAVQEERTVEVEIMHKYAPYGQTTEINAVVYPGTIMKLPVQEAQRALKLGIARATDHTFDV